MTIAPAKTRWRGTFEIASPPFREDDVLCAGSAAPAFRPWRRTRSLHHRQILFAAPGNGRILRRRAAFRRCGTCSAIELQAHSWRPGGIRTHNPVVNSEVSELFTTGAAKRMSGNVRGQNDIRRAGLVARTRVTTPAQGRLHGTHANAAVLERSIRPLHHRQTESGGTNGAALSLPSEAIRTFTTRNSKFSLRFQCRSSSGAGNEKPLASIGSGGVRWSELWNSLRPFRLREKEHAHQRIRPPAGGNLASA